MTQGSLFAWLHLSDIHIGHGGAGHRADQELVLRRLREDVAAQIKAGVPKPDVVLVTGDIAFSGACRDTEEYTRAAAWLKTVADTIGVGLESVYVVPGNHDVQRPVDKPLGAKTLLKALRRGEEDLDEALHEDDTRKHLAARQANYLAFAEQFAHACRAEADTRRPRLYWHDVVVGRGGLRVRLCGLNTALLAGEEAVFGTDKGALWLGNRQLADVLPTASEAGEVVLLLSHHPFVEGWLHDERDARDWSRSHAHIHLSGHVHEAANEQVRAGAGTDFVHIAAGAAHGEAMPAGAVAQHGYSFGALMAEGDGVVLRVWPRRWSQRGKKFQRDQDAADENTGFATHRLARVTLPGAEVVGGVRAGVGVSDVPVTTAPVVSSGALLEQHLLRALEGLLDPQFERLLFLLVEPQRASIPPSTSPRTTRAIELLRLLKQKPDGFQRLHRAIDAEAGVKAAGATSVSALVVPTRAAWASAEGSDTSGRWAEVAVAGVAFRMRWVPPGHFVMGSSETEPGRDNDEGPQHLVVLTQGFWLGETPVTQSLWKEVMYNNPSRFKEHVRPVESVSWDDCQTFVRRVNKMVAGLDLRLPREHEWEYACRGGTQWPTWLGANDPKNLDRIAWYADNAAGQTQPVGLKEANPIGLYDMLGNVWEWCEDWFTEYSAATVVDPPQSEKGNRRVIRGGAWSFLAKYVRAAMRGRVTSGNCRDNLGFRLARG